MEVKVRLSGPFRIGRFKEEVRGYPSGTRVQQVVEELELPQTLLGIVLINGVHADVDDVLNDGDTLALLPLLGGG